MTEHGLDLSDDFTGRPGAAFVVGAASRSTVAISAWLGLLCMVTGEGGGLPSLSMVLRRGGLWGESSLILCYCYFWLQHRDSTPRFYSRST